MKPIYSRRALADLDGIADYYASAASPAVAREIGQRLAEVVAHICQTPLAAPILTQRTGVRAIPVVSYPFRIFYRVRSDGIEIVRIRHTSRRPLRIA
jgi:plasmid stabilization system protein ParE